jgi:hypothetical protein
MLPPDYIIDCQCVDFTIASVTLLKLDFGQIEVYVYPLFSLSPIKQKKVFSSIPADWFEKIEKTNSQIFADQLQNLDKVTYVPKEGVLLCYNGKSFFAPYVKPSPTINMSKKQLSLRFGSNDLREFENDKAVVMILINAIWFFEVNKIKWIVKINDELFLSLYNRIIDCLTNRGGQFNFHKLLSEDENENVLYAQDADMKKRFLYIRNIEFRVYSNLFIPKRSFFTNQVTNLSIITTKVRDARRQKIYPYICTEKEHQVCVIDNSVFVFKKHPTKEAALQWLDKDRRLGCRTSFFKYEPRRFPNVIPQVWYIQTYPSLLDYFNNFIVDVDGYKISLIQSDTSYFVIIPLYIPYISRHITGRRANIVDNIVGLGSNFYWTTSNEVWFFKPPKTTHSVQIAVIVDGPNIDKTILDTEGNVTFLSEPNTIVLNDIIKICSGTLFVYALSLNGTLFTASQTDTPKSPWKACLQKLTNVWCNENIIFGIDDSYLMTWIENVNLVQSSSRIFYYDVPPQKWKTLTSIGNLKFGLTYDGEVYQLKKLLLKLGFDENVIQIKVVEGNLIGWNKMSVYKYTLATSEIEKEQTKILDIGATFQTRLVVKK